MPLAYKQVCKNPHGSTATFGGGKGPPGHFRCNNGDWVYICSTYQECISVGFYSSEGEGETSFRGR